MWRLLLFLIGLEAGTLAPAAYLPNAALTPGDTLPVTVKQVCAPGYARHVRGVSLVTKRAVYAAYGIEKPVPGAYEIDHLIPLELGGSNRRANLWPESRLTSPWNARAKDRLEDRLHRLVCAGTVPLPLAQQEIAADWTRCYQKYFALPPGRTCANPIGPIRPIRRIGQKHPVARAIAPALGAFTQNLTVPVTVSGVEYVWQGNMTFAPVGSESVRAVSGTGTFTLKTPAPLALASVVIQPAAVIGGAGATLTVTLNRAPGVGTILSLKSSDTAVAQVGGSLTILAGQLSGTTVVATLPQANARTVSIITTLNGQSLPANLTVNPQTPQPPVTLSLTGFSISPQTVYAGTTSVGTVSLNRVADQTATIGLHALTPGLTLPPSVTVPVGAASAAFSIGTPATVTADTTYTIEASYDRKVMASLVVKVSAAPPQPGSEPKIEQNRRADGSPIIWPVQTGDKLKTVGQAFGATKGELFVNGSAQPADQWTDTEVYWTVGAAAQSGYPGDVMVRRPDGASYHGMFLADGSPPVPEPPLFTAFTDDAGNKVTSAVAGTRLHLKGGRFGTQPGMVIYSGWALCKIVSWADTEIVFTAPFTWWDKRVSPVEVYLGYDPAKPSLSTVHASTEPLTLLAPPATVMVQSKASKEKARRLKKR